MKRSIAFFILCALALHAGPVRAEETARYAAVETVDASRQLSGSFVSTGAEESAICVTGGTLLLRDASIVRSSGLAAEADALRSGAGAAVLAAGGRVSIRSSAIDTDAPGSAGLFAAAGGEVVAADVAIDTGADASAGLAAAQARSCSAAWSWRRVRSCWTARAAIRIRRGTWAVRPAGSRPSIRR